MILYISEIAKMKINSLTIFQELNGGFLDFIVKILSVDSVKHYLNSIHWELSYLSDCIPILSSLSECYQIQNVYLNSKNKDCSSEWLDESIHKLKKKVGILSWFNI